MKPFHLRKQRLVQRLATLQSEDCQTWEVYEPPRKDPPQPVLVLTPMTPAEKHEISKMNARNYLYKEAGNNPQIFNTAFPHARQVMDVIPGQRL